MVGSRYFLAEASSLTLPSAIGSNCSNSLIFQKKSSRADPIESQLQQYFCTLFPILLKNPCKYSLFPSFYSLKLPTPPFSLSTLATLLSFFNTGSPPPLWWLPPLLLLVRKSPTLFLLLHNFSPSPTSSIFFYFSLLPSHQPHILHHHPSFLSLFSSKESISFFSLLISSPFPFISSSSPIFL